MIRQRIYAAVEVNLILIFFHMVYNYLQTHERFYTFSGICPITIVNVKYSSKTQNFTYLLYFSYRFGKVPSIATSDPGQKNVPAFRPWYIAVSQICRTRIIIVISEVHSAVNHSHHLCTFQNDQKLKMLSRAKVTVQSASLRYLQSRYTIQPDSLLQTPTPLPLLQCGEPGQKQKLPASAARSNTAIAEPQLSTTNQEFLKNNGVSKKKQEWSKEQCILWNIGATVRSIFLILRQIPWLTDFSVFSMVSCQTPAPLSSLWPAKSTFVFFPPQISVLHTLLKGCICSFSVLHVSSHPNFPMPVGFDCSLSTFAIAAWLN